MVISKWAAWMAIFPHELVSKWAICWGLSTSYVFFTAEMWCGSQLRPAKKQTKSWCVYCSFFSWFSLCKSTEILFKGPLCSDFPNKNNLFRVLGSKLSKKRSEIWHGEWAIHVTYPCEYLGFRIPWVNVDDWPWVQMNVQGILRLGTWMNLVHI